MRSKQWIFMAAILGFFSVVIGAFSSHGLDHLPNKALEWIDTASKYQMYHALSLLGLACILLKKETSTASNICGLGFTLGTVCFSGSLYWLAFGGPKLLVYVIPVGGFLLLIGWIAMIFVAMRLDNSSLK